MALNFNVDPYYDDFDKTKNFHRILFKPGYAVQARELTQSQTILQDQISKFGDGIYQDGSKVSGGNITVDTNVVTVKLTSDSASFIDNLTGLFAVGDNSNFVAEIFGVDNVNYYLKTKPINATNNKAFSSGETIRIFNTKIDALASLYSTVPSIYTATAITETTTVKTNVSGTFFDDQLTISTAGINVGDSVKISSANNFSAVIVSIIDTNTVQLNNLLPQDISNASANVSSLCSVRAMEVNVDNGVWYTSGFFVRNDNSSIVPDPLNVFPSAVVGFEVNETIVDSFSDTSLLDPAIGASNYQAPGADRYQITLELVSKPYVSDQTVSNLTTNKFIELVRINKGVVEKISNVPIYSEIAKSIAQGIYDQSGDFIVNSFKIIPFKLSETQSTIPIEISSGKAYINGSKVDHIAPTKYFIEKSRDTDSLSNQDIETYYGNYVLSKNIKGSIVNFQNGTSVELHNVAFGAASSTTKIGTAVVRNFDYDNGTGTASQYKIFLTNVSLANNSFSNVASMIIPGAGSSYTNINFSANTVSPVTLVDSTYDDLLFPLPQKNISTVSNINYVTRRYYSAPTFTNGVYTINTNGASEIFVGGTGSISSALRQLNFGVVTTSASGVYEKGTFIPMDQANVTITISNTGTPQATINIGGGFNGSATIYATISVTSDARKNKVLNSNTYVQISANTINKPIDIGYSDIYNFNGIYEIGNNVFSGTWSSGTTYSANNTVYYNDGKVYISLVGSNSNHQPNTSPTYWSTVTNAVGNYVTDNGQRDYLYDHGTITNKSGVAKGNVVVVFDYFTHSGGTGYFSVNSYPVSYSKIPTFVSPKYGSTVNLRDFLDFRPRRTDGLGNTGFDSYQLPAPLNNVFANYSYYLNRIDKIVLYPNGQFKTIRGISSYINPIPPADMPGALTLFKLNIPAYTFNYSDIINTPTSLRRYTMRDIGLLDQRISNLEYYTSLSLLEKQVTGQDVTDASGQNILFKNGFLVDSFTGSGVSDVNNPDYAAAIDQSNQYARPTFISNVANYFVNTQQGAFKLTPGALNNTLFFSNNIVTFSYDEQSYVFQNVASQLINVNPFNVVNFVGEGKLIPASDVWYDTQSQPIVNIVTEDQAAWVAAVNGTGNGSQWNDWEINWTGESTDTIINSSDTTGQISRDTQAITDAITSKGLQAAISSGPIQVSSTTKTISDAIIPIARSTPVKFEINGLAPVTALHTYINGACVDQYVTPDITRSIYKIDIVNGGSGYADGNNQSIIVISGSSAVQATATANVVGGKIVNVNIVASGDGYFTTPTITVTGSNTSTAILVANTSPGLNAVPLIADVHGYVSGTLTIPNDSFMQFPTGDLLIEWSDNIINPTLSQTYAKSVFNSRGTLSTLQTTVVSTRPPKYTPKPQVVEQYYAPDYSTPDPIIPSDQPYLRNDSIASGASTYDASAAKNFLGTFIGGVVASQTSVGGVSNQALINSTVQAVYNSYDTIYNTFKEINGGANPTGTQVAAAALVIAQTSVQTGGSNLSTATSDIKNTILSNASVLNSPTAIATVATNYITSLPSSAQTAIGNAWDAAAGACFNGSDPLSQNFFVDASLYPRGIFLSSIDLFFATKDPVIPVSIRIRPTVNGYPDSSNEIPGSIVYKNPADINIPDVASQTKQIGPSTTFNFDFPIYLKPGEYTVMVAADSNQYTMYASKVGQVEYGTNRLINQLNYTGSLFKSQNASTWVAAPGETLCFKLKYCVFAGGTTSFDITSKNSSSPIYYDLMNLMTQDLSFTGFSGINYNLLTTDAGTSSTSTINTTPNQNIQFASRQIQSSQGNILVKPTMTNLDKYTSPVIDLERLNTILVKNIVSSYSSANTAAESLGGLRNTGGSVAKYITRRVTLNNNFDASGLTVYVDVNRQPGTYIEVYYKVLNKNDGNNFDNNPYVLMTPKFTVGGSLETTGPDTWTTDTYQALNISYRDVASNALYNNFNVFAIKVVFYSSNPSIVPKIKNFRAIATA